MQITLKDGAHELQPPTFYALVLASEYGVDFDSGLKMADVPAIIAALLTDSEPLKDGKPKRKWSAVEVAKLMDPKDLATMLDAVSELLNDAFPEGEESSERPTSA